MSDVPQSIHPLLQHHFENRRLNVLSIGGRPAWIARELGEAIGYALSGKRLIARIREAWAPEFIEGHDFASLTGGDLAQVKGLVEPDVIDPRTPSLLVLFEPGVHLVLTKTSKPLGRTLRRYLVDHVFPQLVRTGRFVPPPAAPPPTPEADVDRVLMLFPQMRPRKPALHVQREERMRLQARTRAQWVDVCDRRLQVSALHRLVDAVGDALGAPRRLDLELLAAEIATGLPVRELVGDPTDPDDDADAVLDAAVDAALDCALDEARREAA
jgi:prophage antirepressor-like protein